MTDVRERVLVCVSRPGDSRTRWSAGVADRAAGAGASSSCSTSGRARARPTPSGSHEMESLARDLGGAFDVVDSETPVDAVLGYAYRHSVTQIVVGRVAPLTLQGADAGLVRHAADPGGRRTSTSTSSRDASTEARRAPTCAVRPGGDDEDGGRLVKNFVKRARPLDGLSRQHEPALGRE